MELLHKVENIVIHHSKRHFDSPGFIRLRHKFLRGREDIGYHFLIANGTLATKVGEVVAGRSGFFQGAHVSGHNTNSLGVCFIGDFDKKIPNELQRNAGRDFVAGLVKKYQLAIEDVLGHNEIVPNVKTCPGLYFNMNMFRTELSNLLTKEEVPKKKKILYYHKPTNF